MYRKYYSYNDMPVPIKKEHPPKDAPSPSSKPPQTSASAPAPAAVPPPEKKNGVLSGLDNDDLILILIALVLIMNDCDDKILLAAIAFVFFSGLDKK